MDPISRVNAVLDFHQPDRLPQCNFFTDGFIRAHRYIGRNIYTDFGCDIVPLFPNLMPDPSFRTENKSENGTFTDGWGRTCRHTRASGFVEVLEYATLSVDTLPNFKWSKPDAPERFEAVTPGNAHHERAFVAELEVIGKSAFLCGNVYDPFETLARVIGLRNALIALKTHPDELKVALAHFGTCMKEMGSAQVRYGAGKLCGIWIWGDIAYTRGLMMAPMLYRELILPPLRDMCNAFRELGVRVIYHTDGDPSAVIPDLIGAGVEALHPVEQLPGMEIGSLMRDYYGKIAFIGGIPPVDPKKGEIMGGLEPILAKMLDLGANGGLIPGFTHFIPISYVPGLLGSIKNYFVDHGHAQRAGNK